MSKKHLFIGSFINVIKHNKDGAYRTQDDRRQTLEQIALDLWNLGYKLDGAQFIRTRHIYKLVDHWKAQAISAGRMRNKMAAMRWLMEKFNKAPIVPDNDTLKIPKREYLLQDKSRSLSEAELAAITDPYRKASLEAQRLFGLRVEESLKIQPHVADQGNQLYLKGSWTKGGRERSIPITTEAQRDWVEKAKALVKHKSNSLIPADRSYKTYRNTFNQYLQRHDIHKTHGLRHAYAQQRYKELTGWECSAKGGPSKKQLTPEQQVIDHAARLQITSDLGHGRLDILSVYIGI